MSRIDDNKKLLQELTEEIEGLEAEILKESQSLSVSDYDEEYLDDLNRRLDYLNNEELIPLLDRMEFDSSKSE